MSASNKEKSEKSLSTMYPKDSKQAENKSQLSTRFSQNFLRNYCIPNNLNCIWSPPKGFRSFGAKCPVQLDGTAQISNPGTRGSNDSLAQYSVIRLGQQAWLKPFQFAAERKTRVLWPRLVRSPRSQLQQTSPTSRRNSRLVRPERWNRYRIPLPQG